MSGIGAIMCVSGMKRTGISLVVEDDWVEQFTPD